MNYFVEGLQGSGKSTLVERIAKNHRGYTAIHEGDYSPVELAWCAYVSHMEYQEILDKYNEIRSDIELNSYIEKDHVVICYTQVITDIPGFHKDLEQYEIYNGRVAFDEFKRIVLSRYGAWSGDKMIFECSLFQNIIEEMILFRDASDKEIIGFYREIREALKDNNFRIIYLETEDIKKSIDIIRRERSDDQGNELWFPMMLKFFDESPYAKNHGVTGEAAMLEHFRHRQELELQICSEVFSDRCEVLQSKRYREEDI